jgi:Mrp family chromosome partitioning ATPase
LITALRSLADVIVIDAPPAMALADASLLAKHSDGAILIATVGRTGRPLLRDAAELLRQNGVTVLGAIANRSRRSLPRSYAPYYVVPHTATRET